MLPAALTSSGSWFQLGIVVPLASVIARVGRAECGVPLLKGLPTRFGAPPNPLPIQFGLEAEEPENLDRVFLEFHLPVFSPLHAASASNAHTY